MKKIFICLLTALFLVSCSTPVNTDENSNEKPVATTPSTTTPTTTPTATTPEQEEPVITPPIEEEPVVTPEPSEQPETEEPTVEPEPVEEPTEPEEPQNSETEESGEDSIWRLVEKDETSEAGIEYFIIEDKIKISDSYTLNWMIENNMVKFEYVGTKTFTGAGTNVSYYFGNKNERAEVIKYYKVYINKNITEKTLLSESNYYLTTGSYRGNYGFEITDGKMKAINYVLKSDMPKLITTFNRFYK